MTQSIQRIKASDGSSNANLATVQSTRSSGATTIVVDTVVGFNGTSFEASMGTPHTFTDPVTSETITVISEATCVDFVGHVNGVNLVIDSIAPGYTDLGSAVGDVVIVRPTTDWANNVAEVLGVSHNDDGTIKNGAVSNQSMLASNVITSEEPFADAVDPVLRASELIFDHINSGCVITGTGLGSTLAWSMSSGIVYINGKRLTFAGASGSVTATKDTYFDLHDNGDGTAVLVNTGSNIVTVNAASPTLASNSVRAGIIQSGANIADAAHINQGEFDRVVPIASSIPYCFTDSLGNIIHPTDPQQKTLGYRQIITDFNSASSPVDITGLNLNFKCRAGDKVEVVGFIGGPTSSAVNNAAVMLLLDVTGSVTLVQGVGSSNASGDMGSVNPSRAYIPGATTTNIKAQLGHGANAATTHTQSSSTNPSYIKVKRA